MDIHDLSGFTLRVELGNEAMSGPPHVADLLRRAAGRIEGHAEDTYAALQDRNGNSVGFFEFTTHDEPLGRWPGGGPVVPGDL